MKTVNCPACGEPLELRYSVSARSLSAVDGPLVLDLDVDASPFREHLAKHDGGPDGGDREPLPIGGQLE